MIEFGTWRTGTLSEYTYTWCCCGHNGTIYAFGNNEPYPSCVSALLAYDMDMATWRELSELPTPRFGFQTAVVNNRLYTIGGSTSHSNGVYHNTLSIVEIYDLLTGEWTTGADKITAIANNGGVVVGDKIYCIGGALAGSSSAHSNTVEVYDTVADSWSSETNLPYKMNVPNCTAVGTDIYMTGVMITGSGTSALSYKYNTITKQWSSISPLLLQACMSSTGYYEGKILCAGGDTARWTGSPINRLQVYDIATDTWSDGPPMPGAQTGVGLVYKNRFYACGEEMYILSLQPESRLRLLLEQGESQQLAGILLPSGATVEDVDWSSDNTSIAQVDENGLATGIGVGKAVVTVTAKDGSWSDSILIQVLEAEVEPEYRLSILLKTGETCRLAASDDLDEVFLWTSDDTNVAIVSDTGKVTAISPGVTIITVMSGDGAFEDQIYVKVED